MRGAGLPEAERDGTGAKKGLFHASKSATAGFLRPLLQSSRGGERRAQPRHRAGPRLLAVVVQLRLGVAVIGWITAVGRGSTDGCSLGNNNIDEHSSRATVLECQGLPGL